jgi:hypothetical protein
MKGLKRGCLGLAVTGVSVLGIGASAHADRPASLGIGAPPGQVSVQLYDWSNYINTASGPGEINPPAPTALADRLERSFAFIQSRGLHNVELFGYTGFPSTTDTAGQATLKALGDKYGLHFAGRHGDLTESVFNGQLAESKNLAQDFIGAADQPNSPGIGSLANTLLTAALFDREGKLSMEAGLGPVYFHNHQSQFTTRYTDSDGVNKTAWEIIMDHSDPRYVNAEIDVFWAVSGLTTATNTPDQAATQVAALINKYAPRVSMLHIKDGINPSATAGTSVLRELGNGVVNFAPILAAARGKVKYYHYEYDPVNPGANTSTGNPAGFNPFNSTTTSLNNLTGDPAPSIAAFATKFLTPRLTTSAPQVITVKNNGNAPLHITGATIQPIAGYTASEYAVTGQTCTTAAIAPGGTCTASVTFSPAGHGGANTIAYLHLASDADEATNIVLLAGQATDSVAPSVSLVTPPEGATYYQGAVVNAAYTCADDDQVATCNGPVANGAPIDTSTVGEYVFTVIATDSAGNTTSVSHRYHVFSPPSGTSPVSGSVAATLSLALGAPANFGSFTAGLAKDYTASTTATVTSTGGDATLVVADPGATNVGHMVNGTFVLAQALQARANTAAYQPISGSDTPTVLLTYPGPVSNDVVTLGFKQSIGVNEALRTGQYHKTVTFTLSTTTP